MNALARFFWALLSALEFHMLRFSRLWLVFLACLIFLFGSAWFLLAPPPGSSLEHTVVITRGMPLDAVAQELAAAHVIAHPLLLRLLLRATGEDGALQAGAYRFASPETLITVMQRLITGEYGLPSMRITFSEGATVRDMAARVAETFPEVSAADFIAAGQPYEGYLFPDTYFFPPSADASSIVAAMRANFNTKIASISPEIQASGHSLASLVIMASLIEKEARTDAVRRMVSGILWNRIQRGMPLQVDAVFGYINGRDTYAPSLSDLTIDSPYNTYIHKGLPPGPIDNPGLASLEAAAQPTKTKYLYYLTDKNGVMHYATTYAGHEANLRKYLQ